MRIFFAHPKSMDDAEIDSWGREIKKLFVDAEDLDTRVVPGRDDFQQYAVGAGSFTAWAREVPTRRDMGTGRPYYSAFVSVNAYVGRATADILRGALNTGTPVIYLEKKEDGAVEPHRVNQVVVVDPEDYLKGWCLDT